MVDKADIITSHIMHAIRDVLDAWDIEDESIIDEIKPAVEAALQNADI